MSSAKNIDKIQPQWFSKTLVSGILGLTLAYGIIATFAWYGPGGIDADVKVQFNMWAITPIWLLVVSFSYLFKNVWRMVQWLVAANVITYGLYYILGWGL